MIKIRYKNYPNAKKQDSEKLHNKDFKKIKLHKCEKIH